MQYGGTDPPPWQHVHSREGKNQRGRGRSSFSQSTRSSYDSSFPVIQLGSKTLINSKIGEASSSASSSINLKDIPKDSSLYEQIQAYLQKKEQGDTYASLAREVDLVRVSEEASTKEIIFLLENSYIQRSNEPWKILQRYLTKGLYFPGEAYKTRTYYESTLSHTRSAEFQHFTSKYDKNVYNFSKITIKQIISAEEWGISTMQERSVSVYKVNMNFTYWDYIQAFHKNLLL